MSVHINDLSYDLLKQILGFLPDKQLFFIESVCIKWQKCVKKLLAQKQVLHCLDNYSLKFQNQGFGQKVIIDNSNINILKKILSKCCNIKQLDLSDTKVTGENNFITIANKCPKLERINFNGSNIDVSEDEINEFAKMIGPQLTKCSLIFIYYFNLTLFKHLENIEDISFTSDKKEQEQQLFHYLNIKGKHLKVLKWNSSRKNLDFINDDFINDDFINVIQRIEHLKICLSNLLEFKFEMNNLTELTIYQGLDVNKNMVGMTFANLKKLNIVNFSDSNYDSISNFEFPKLESANIINEFYYKIPTSFIDKMKDIKSLEYYCCDYDLIPSMVLSMKQLTNFVWVGISLSSCSSFSQLYQCFDLLSHHESLENIEFRICDSNITVDLDFFEKLIILCKAKPKTKTVIRIPKPSDSVTNVNINPKVIKKINDYKKLFDSTSHLHKLNMELLYKYDDYFQ